MDLACGFLGRMIQSFEEMVGKDYAIEFFIATLVGTVLGSCEIGFGGKRQSHSLLDS